MKSLVESRKIASEMSGGSSALYIKQAIISRLESYSPHGSLIDFGAGTGVLLRMIHKLGVFDSLTGVDLYQRPVDLPREISWREADLNDFDFDGDTFDFVICSETIEHLENPRQTFRSLASLLKPGGILILTMPNQESIRSLLGLLLRGHFTHFHDSCYPAHITALLHLDLVRLCSEAELERPEFFYTNMGMVPKLTALTWQQISFGILKGKFFSDNLGMVTRKPLPA
jgi:2-polyprenyl-3-methyl-5-hydroxy-6-metoxy-1,4-benzoquinol methylase